MPWASYLVYHDKLHRCCVWNVLVRFSLWGCNKVGDTFLIRIRIYIHITSRIGAWTLFLIGVANCNNDVKIMGFFVGSEYTKILIGGIKEFFASINNHYRLSCILWLGSLLGINKIYSLHIIREYQPVLEQYVNVLSDDANSWMLKGINGKWKVIALQNVMKL